MLNCRDIDMFGILNNENKSTVRRTDSLYSFHVLKIVPCYRHLGIAGL